MRIRLESIGCRLNISEIEKMARDFASSGHRLVGPGEVADLYVFNSCAVTHTAARKSRQIMRQMRRANPAALVVATGCYTQLEPDKVKALGVDMLIDNGAKDRLPQLLDEAGLLRDADPIPEVDAPSFIMPDTLNHTRAFVKVQDGCDNKCTFCIVTVARGVGRSHSIEDVVAEINRLVKLGYQEAVVSGVHLGSYGHDVGDRDGLKHLVQAIMNDSDLPRLRLSSLEPWDLDEDFFTLWQNKRVLPHLHLPLQSGCDATLRRMARRTTQTRFARLVEQARAAIPDLSITTDIIVGFPGESDAEFETSIEFVEHMAFARLHIFRYSRREGTAAASMPQQVAPQIAQQRSQRMHVLNAELERNFYQKFIGRTMPVLWENSEPFGFGLRWSGLTANYVRVFVESGIHIDLRNKVTDVKLIESLPGAVSGQVDSPNN